MKHTTRKQFEIFKKEFTLWQHKFGLLEWVIFFDWKDDGGFAAITTDHEGMAATVSMAKTMKDIDWQDFNPKDSAKHEAIHLLTADLWFIGSCRNVKSGELSQAWEKLTVKLEKLLK